MGELMAALALTACTFTGRPIINCAEQPPAVVAAWRASYRPCKALIPPEHLRLVREWEIGSDALGGRATYHPPRVRLGLRASCRVLAHEIGHQVQRAYALPGGRESFARDYARRALAGIRPLWGGTP